MKDTQEEIKIGMETDSVEPKQVGDIKPLFNDRTQIKSNAAYDLLMKEKPLSVTETTEADPFKREEYLARKSFLTRNKAEPFKIEEATEVDPYKQFYINNGKLSWEKPEPECHGCNDEGCGFCEEEAVVITPESVNKQLKKLDIMSELKEKYATGKYDAYCIMKNEEDTWDRMISNPSFNQTNVDYKLILKEHSHIADAVLENPDVEVEYKNTNGWYKDDFFENYHNNGHMFQWRIKPTQVATHEFNKVEPDQYKQEAHLAKQAHFAKPKETLVITTDDRTVYEFEKPEFECELLKVTDKGIIGIVSGNATRWTQGGVCVHIGASTFPAQYNLTPIAKPWYEDKSILSKENPKLMVIKETDMKIWAYGYDSGCFLILEYFYEQGFIDKKKVRLATKEECLSLYYQDKDKL